MAVPTAVPEDSIGTRFYLSCRTTAADEPVVPIQVHTPKRESCGLEVAVLIGSLAGSAKPHGRHLDTRSRGRPTKGHTWATLRLDCGNARAAAAGQSERTSPTPVPTGGQGGATNLVGSHSQGRVATAASRVMNGGSITQRSKL